MLIKAPGAHTLEHTQQHSNVNSGECNGISVCVYWLPPPLQPPNCATFCLLWVEMYVQMLIIGRSLHGPLWNSGSLLCSRTLRFTFQVSNSHHLAGPRKCIARCSLCWFVQFNLQAIFHFCFVFALCACPFHSFAYFIHSLHCWLCSCVAQLDRKIIYSIFCRLEQHEREPKSIR